MDQVSTATLSPTPKSIRISFLATACLISYGILTALVIFQNRTIHVQRDLIHLLFKDRQRFTHVAPGGAASSYPADHGQARSSSPAQSSSPSSQGKSEMDWKSKRNSRRNRNRASAKPHAQVVDPSDIRRVSISI